MPQRGADRERGEVLPRSGAELSALVSRGDRRALGELYELWFDRLYAQARTLTGRDEAFCLDVVQEVTLRIARFMRPMASDDDLARWLNRVVHTTAIDLLRRESRRAARQRRSASGEVNACGEPVDERIEWLRQRLSELPAEEHRLLWLRYAVGSTLAAAGALTGMSGDRAHVRLRRTVTRLRASAKEEINDTV